ncbi:AraC family transcriptional regulator [Staphylococcus caeli]|uniref:AraC family transcriptional regulator n=1 Tax=Staphylococcus caeli TaxID=2201815 RepID=UPI003F5714D1
MYKDVLIESNGEERIQYEDRNWKHIVLKTKLNEMTMGYIPIHWHRALQFVFVIKGQLKIIIGNKEKLLDKGDGIFINSDIVHEIQEIEQFSEFYCWNIGIPEVTNYMEYKYINQIVQQAQDVPYIYLSQWNVYHNRLLNIVETVGKIYNEKEQYFELDIMMHFYHTLKCLLYIMDHEPNDFTYKFDGRIKQVMLYIQQHFSEKVTLKHLSQLIYLSEAETIKLFKKNVKQTPFEYLTKYRLEQSMYMLKRDEQYTITEIGMACGFSTTSYFIKVFKEAYQMTPKQYQKQLSTL